MLFSGTAFVIAMTGMLLVPDTILRSLAAGAVLVGITAVAAATTLLPAVLSLLGDRVDALRLPLVGRGSGEGRFWGAVVVRVQRRPLVYLLASTAFLVALTLPALDLRTGSAGVRTIPDGYASKDGFNALERELGVGTVDTAEIVVEGDVAAPPVRQGLERLRAELASDTAFRNPELETAPDARLAVVEALVAGDSRDERSVQAIERLRTEVVPRALGDADVTVYVTGETAEILDYRELMEDWLPIVFAFVLGFSFILLTVAFRSIVVPAKAIALNLLSVGAAYGLIVLVFQDGVGNELFGFPQVDAIEAWLPLFLFSVLFGLSMDYHVFLLSRIRERYTQTGDSSEAVAFGVRTTARLITGAALIIIVVFIGFATGELVMFQQMGFGVAVALLIDATLIRSVLVPAAMELLGERNWYLPQLARVATSLRGRSDELGDPAADHLALILLEEVAGAGDDLRLAGAGDVRRDPLGRTRREDRVGVGEEDERRPVPLRQLLPDGEMGRRVGMVGRDRHQLREGEDARLRLGHRPRRAVRLDDLVAHRLHGRDLDEAAGDHLRAEPPHPIAEAEPLVRRRPAAADAGVHDHELPDPVRPLDGEPEAHRPAPVLDDDGRITKVELIRQPRDRAEVEVVGVVLEPERLVRPAEAEVVGRDRSR